MAATLVNSMQRRPEAVARIDAQVELAVRQLDDVGRAGAALAAVRAGAPGHTRDRRQLGERDDRLRPAARGIGEHH